MNIIRYYNQNRKKIWGIVIIIAFALLMLYLLNYIVSINDEENLQEQNSEVNIITNSSTITTNESVVTGEKVSSKQLKTQTETIDQFISLCNEKNLQEAYDLLTEECKQQLYNSVEVFENAYYNNVFNRETRTATIENWVNNTYKVRLVENLLATGKSNNGYAKQDYITVVKVGEEYKLNINNYIGYTEINKLTTQDDITVEIVGKNTFMDYEEYSVKVTNNTGKEISLNGGNNVKAVYIEDERGSKYSFYNHELTDAMLSVEDNHTRELNIKFYSSYTSTKNIDYLVFSDVFIYDGQLTEKKEIRANV